MATKENLMGLGVPMHVARVLGRTPTLVTAAGTTISDGTVISGHSYDAVVATGTGGIVLKSPASVGSDVLLGDEFYISNITAASIAIFVRNALIYVNGLSVSGTGGISVGIGQSCILRPISASTWTCIGSVLSNA